MKIALAIEHFSRHAGGAESYSVELARALIREGWEVHVYGYSWDGEPQAVFFHKLRELPRWVPPSVRIVDFALLHRKLVRQMSFDVVLGFGNTVEMNVYQSHGGVHFLSNSRKSKAVRNPIFRLLKMLALFFTPKYHARSWIESAPFRLPERPVIIAISDMVRNDIAQYFSVDKESIRLVYNGIDQEKFARPRGRGREELRKSLGFGNEVLFLFMAYDFRKKGVRYLIEAAAHLRGDVGNGSFGLVIVGGKPYPSLLRLLKKKELRRLVVFPGATKEPESFYRACDVFVLPTFYDACSLVVFEAMAAGLPVITSAYNGAAGIMSSGVDGIVLQDPTDVAEIASSMNRFLDREFLHTASDTARKTATRYTLKANHSQMIEIFNEVIQKKRSTLTRVTV